MPFLNSLSFQQYIYPTIYLNNVIFILDLLGVILFVQHTDFSLSFHFIIVLEMTSTLTNICYKTHN